MTTPITTAPCRSRLQLRRQDCIQTGGAGPETAPGRGLLGDPNGGTSAERVMEFVEAARAARGTGLMVGGRWMSRYKILL